MGANSGELHGNARMNLKTHGLVSSYLEGCNFLTIPISTPTNMKIRTYYLRKGGRCREKTNYLHSTCSESTRSISFGLLP